VAFKVVEVIDGDTFKVSPGWEWQGNTGDTVRVHGYNAPEEGEPGYDSAKSKLKGMLLGKEVELKTPVNFSHGRLVCQVLLEGKNVADSFK
jgi:endonuclease YncB( thermonuclease family)